MNLALTLYLIDLLDGFSNASSCLGAIIFIIVGLIWIFHILTAEDLPKDSTPVDEYGYSESKAIYFKNLALKSKFLIVLFIIMLLVNAFIPSKKTMYLMASGHYLTNAEIPLKLKQVLENKLDGILDEAKQKLIEDKK